MEPSEYPVEPANTVFDLVWASTSDGVLPVCDHAIQVVRMHCTVESPILQVFESIPEVLEHLPVDVFHLSSSRHGGNERRNRIDDQTKLELAVAKRFLGALTIFVIKLLDGAPAHPGA